MNTVSANLYRSFSHGFVNFVIRDSNCRHMHDRRAYETVKKLSEMKC